MALVLGVVGTCHGDPDSMGDERVQRDTKAALRDLVFSEVAICLRSCGGVDMSATEGKTMTDQEIIATWMEPKPTEVPESAEDRYLRGSPLRTPLGFWICVSDYEKGEFWSHRHLDLDASHEVEARLIREGEAGLKGVATEQGVSALHRLSAYNIAMRQLGNYTWHASAEQKITALATVLRPIVEVRL
jgi:hypothetical protein